MTVNQKSNFLIQHIKFLRKMFPAVKGFIICNELHIKVPAHQIKHFLQFLKMHTNTQYKVLIDICAVDYPEKKFRFELIYHLLSINYNARINVQISVEDSFPVESVTSIHSGAD
jgi:NADH:ubiquinone oxidoreductase subunit C